MANKENKRKLTFEEKCLVAITAGCVGGIGAAVGLYAGFLHKLKLQNSEALDKSLKELDGALKEQDKHNGDSYDKYLNMFLNYICGKSEKVRDVLLEEGVISGPGWGLPLKNEE